MQMPVVAVSAVVNIVGLTIPIYYHHTTNTKYSFIIKNSYIYHRYSPMLEYAD